MLKFSNSYIELGEEFFKRGLPQKAISPELLLWNSKLANSLLISPSLQNDGELLSQYFSGNQIPENCDVIALAYSGHQFGHFNPNLGDGRAHLLGELKDEDGNRRDIQLKGSGQTAFSRRGDGKCALGPALREYIMSEALFALGVPTSRCLAVVATGELINRGLAKPGAVVTRVADSHIRVGSFQHFAARGDIQALNKLVDYSIERHFPEILEKNTTVIIDESLTKDDRVLQFLDNVIDKQITLIIEWLRIGFIHGVMNTDNTAICGETIDFGPCAMMGGYDEKAVFSSIDEYGRYAFGNQGKIGQWNMARLADCLLLLLTTNDENKAEQSNTKQNDTNNTETDKQQQALHKVERLIHQYPDKFKQAYYVMYANKLGMNEVNEVSITLVEDLLAIMQENSLDYTQTFHSLTQQALSYISKAVFDAKTIETLKHNLDHRLNNWCELWISQLSKSNLPLQEAIILMQKNNPVVIPRNHHVEALLDRCEQVVLEQKKSGNIQTIITDMVEEFLTVLRTPYQETIATKAFQDTPKDNDKYYQTFCGT